MATALRMVLKGKKWIEKYIEDQIHLRRLISYKKSDRRPWRTGYSEYRLKYLNRIISDDAMLNIFLKSEQLPDGFGFRLDARMVEIPWVLARLRCRQGQVLDAGSSLNSDFILRNPILCDKRVIIVTLAPERKCYWNMGVSYIFGDLRNLDFKNDHFDSIVCISTIEHVGMDNRMYAGDTVMAKEGDAKEFLLAVRELKRVLKSDCVLYITFPFGRYENHGWFQQFNSKLTDQLIGGFGPSHFNETVFRYDPDGWRLCDRVSCAHSQFFDVRTSKYFDSGSTIEYPSDYPAGERAVACLELFK